MIDSWYDARLRGTEVKGVSAAALSSLEKIKGQRDAAEVPCCFCCHVDATNCFFCSILYLGAKYGLKPLRIVS